MMRLKCYLHMKGIKIKSFAMRAGVNSNLLSDALAGRRRIPPKHWRRIARLTNQTVKLEDLYNEAYPE